MKSNIFPILLLFDSSIIKNHIRIFKKSLFLFAFSLQALYCFGQKEGNIWTFPDSLSIDFNGPLNPVVFASAIAPIGFGYPGSNQSTIADSNGNLFCYAAATTYSFSGLQVFDRIHNIMPNGQNLQGHPIESSLLLPIPAYDSLICLFHIAFDSVNTNISHLYYSLINKNLHGGLGDVSLRDSVIYTNDLSSFKLTACKHANGRDWWIFIYDRTITSYVSFLLSPSGITYSNSQSVGPSPNCQYFGKILFSNDGTKMMAVGKVGCINVFDFERCTGVLSNYRDIGEHLSTEEYQYFNAAFSPNGNVIYVSPYNIVKTFYQWNLNAPNIPASKTLLNEYPDTGTVINNTYFGHKLAPDGKIYIPICNNYFGGSNGNTFVTQHLDVIEYPDTPGLGCNYIRQAFDLGGGRVTGDLPNIPYYGLGPVPGSICDSLSIGINEKNFSTSGIEVFPNPSSGIYYLKLKDKTDRIISLSVENIFGKEIPIKNNFTPTLDLSNYPAGIYFARVVTQKKKIFAAKLVKE